MERRSPERNVYVVGYRNMHPDVTHRILAELRERMAREGYEPVGEPVVFGGPTGLLFSYRFRLAGA